MNELESWMNLNSIPIEEVQSLSRRKGFHFFDTDTIRFFSSRVDNSVLAPKTINEKEGYFITSERNTYTTNPRAYTIRAVNLVTGDIRTIGEFQQFSTKAMAYAVLKEYSRYVMDEGHLTLGGWLSRIEEIEKEKAEEVRT